MAIMCIQHRDSMHLKMTYTLITIRKNKRTHNLVRWNTHTFNWYSPYEIQTILTDLVLHEIIHYKLDEIEE